MQQFQSANVLLLYLPLNLHIAIFKYFPVNERLIYLPLLLSLNYLRDGSIWPQTI